MSKSATKFTVSPEGDVTRIEGYDRYRTLNMVSVWQCSEGEHTIVITRTMRNGGEIVRAIRVPYLDDGEPACVRIDLDYNEAGVIDVEFLGRRLSRWHDDIV